MAKQVLEILSIVAEQIKTKDGKDMTLPKAQVVLHTEGKPAQVAIWLLPRDMAESVKPGRYVADVEFRASRDGQLESRIVGLAPFK